MRSSIKMRGQNHELQCRLFVILGIRIKSPLRIKLKLRWKTNTHLVKDYIDYVYETMEEDSDLTFDAVILQAIARNTAGVPAPSFRVVKDIQDELIRAGLTRVDRKRFMDPFVRGVQSPAHGRHPFAGQSGGGSGMGSNREDPVGFGTGGGPGAVGGKYTWDADDKKNLPMGASSRKK